MIRKPWWKILSFVLLAYTCIAGFLITVPTPPGVPLQQTIRNLFFHVPMWFGMTILFTVSVIYAVKYLINPSSKNDTNSFEFAKTGIVLGLLGYATGMIWANYTWGKPISGDPKQIGAAIGVLIYCAYFVLRGNVVDDKKARISAVYNIFAFAMLFPCLYILPRLVESLHPGGMGTEGNPGLNPKDSNALMKLVFWPAV
ncbi:MAG: cytochrome c biogenesis protein CcsA, partial [Bacteroidetes bacterium]|nr:cytochrome c biogenesis protein CcsA [Bacteroidota bacterium]